MPSCADFSSSLGFVILSPEPNIARLKDTVRSIGYLFGDAAPIVCSVAKGAGKSRIEEMKGVCSVVEGGSTIMSLINRGMKACKGEGWRMLVMEGARIPRGIEKRYSRWIRDEKDVLFPITVSQDREGRPLRIMANFEECTLNGIAMHTSLFKEVGEFSDNPIAVSKSFWAVGALQSGATFKAVLGVKVI
jgi:hypothetical protein